MVAAYDAGPWSDLYVATAGAGAALAGLVFVAVSINIGRILKMEGVAERGLQTVLMLLGVVVVSVCGLVPQQVGTLAVELIVAGGVLVLWLAGSMPKSLAGTRGHPVWFLSRVIVFVPGTVCYVIGGVSTLVRAGGGLAWIVTGIVAAMIGAVINAWVLLVEILR